MAEPTRKRKRVSKNKKKSWRKHTDIADVEDFLDDVRLQERTGGIVAEKADDHLFFVDKTEEKHVETVSQRKSKRIQKPLRCHSNLWPDTKVKPLLVTNNKKTDSLKKKDKHVREKIENNILSKCKVASLKQSVEARKSSRLKSIQRKKVFEANKDLWGKAKDDMVDEYYAKQTKLKTPKMPTQMFKKPSGLPAVEVSHPGSSYNPSYEDHQDLLAKAYVIELDKLKKEEKITRKLDSQFPAQSDAPTQESWLKEMSAGLMDEADSDAEQSDLDLDKISVNPPVRREDKKTEKQRKKEKLRKEKESKLVNDKMKRSMDQELFRLKSIKKDVRQMEELLVEKLKRRKELREKYKNKPKKLGQLKYEEPDLELHLTEELTGSLRLIKPEGNVLNDRFKSYQRRNIIETRVRAKYKLKYKPKTFEKAGHKEVTV